MYPEIVTPSGRKPGRAKLSWVFECVVRAVTGVGLDDEERRPSDVRVLLPADEETEDRTIYVYLSSEWIEKNASHCVLIRKGAMPHMRRGHTRRQRVGPGLAETKEVWIRNASVKEGQRWAEYRVAPNKPRRKEKPA
jgi:hypothetical protein